VFFPFLPRLLRCSAPELQTELCHIVSWVVPFLQSRYFHETIPKSREHTPLRWLLLPKIVRRFKKSRVILPISFSPRDPWSNLRDRRTQLLFLSIIHVLCDLPKICGFPEVPTVKRFYLIPQHILHYSISSFSWSIMCYFFGGIADLRSSNESLQAALLWYFG
jgi:hypothetical protein